MVVALFLLGSEDSAAQITSVTTSISDSVVRSCYLPNNASFMVSGNVMGTGSLTDSMTHNINFGDGTDTTYKSRIYYGSGTGYFNSYPYHNYTMPGTYTVRLISIAPGGIRDTVYNKPFTLTTTCGTLTGNLYMDANSNCVKDAGENEMYWTPVVAINTTTLDSFNAGWSDLSGHYSLSLPAGNYNIIPNYYCTHPGIVKANTFATPSCPSTGAYSLTVAASGTYTKDFAYSCSSPTSYDAQVVVAGGCFFPGDTTFVYAWGGAWSWYFAYSCLSMGTGTTVTLNLDSKLTYMGVSYGPTPSVSGSTLTYTLSTLTDLTHFYSAVYVRTSTSATIGDTIRISGYIAPLSTVTDPNLANNTYNYKKAVVSSYDPNIKEVAPLGAGTKGYITKNENMTYTIHFQNTGTAPARNITITDEIDNDLDINSLHILGATHNANLYREGSKIKFRFENINLPDSGSNYKGSMGSITYAIKQKKDLAPGTEIKNTAAIYFDYNSPIITNTTLNTIYIPTSVQNVSLGSNSVSVYPNPANTALTVKMSNNGGFSVRMLDLLGRVVLLQHTADSDMMINTQSIAEGVYILRINDEKGNESSAKVQIKH